MSDYQGWKNRATWNIALWINNDFQLYSQALEFVNDYKGKKPYEDFVKVYNLNTTPDHFSFTDESLDIVELDSMMEHL
tara:strand:+ start:3112 stop:3345 length:234 start_codon:yes stop_codon:yes gene_type:complete